MPLFEPKDWQAEHGGALMSPMQLPHLTQLGPSPKTIWVTQISPGDGPSCADCGSCIERMPAMLCQPISTLRKK
jgi:hypothetical protein